MVEPLRHRQTKEAETDMFSLPPPRHIPTPPCVTSNAGPTPRNDLPVELSKWRIEEKLAAVAAESAAGLPGAG
jgi:hypothetical protein